MKTVTLVAIVTAFLALPLFINPFIQPHQPEVFPVRIDDSVNAVPLKRIHVGFSELPAQIQEEIRCLAHNIYFEARSEPVEGQYAVAHVTLNRVESSLFPQTICGVVRQRNTRVCQFSWWCDNRLRTNSINNRIAEREVYYEIKQLATFIVLNRKLREDSTNGALFYHATYIEKRRLGSMSLIPTATIGRHVFYRMNS